MHGHGSASSGGSTTTAAAEPSFFDANPRLFFLFTAVPPASLLCSLLSVRSASKWFAAWWLYQYVPVSRRAHALGGHALTVYASYASLDDQLFPADGHAARRRSQ